MEQVVPGDIVILAAGDVIPGDCLLLESKELFVDEAALTGETYPVEKSVTVLPADTPLNQTDQHPVYGDPRGQRQRRGPWSSAPAPGPSSARSPNG